MARYTVKTESWESLFEHFRNHDHHTLDWATIFILPGWLKAWWTSFGQDAELTLLSIQHEGEIIGIAPMQVRQNCVRLIGDVDVSDHVDCIVAPQWSVEFYRVLLDHFQQSGITRLELGLCREDSSIYMSLLKEAQQMGWRVACQPRDYCYEMRLPIDWEYYLQNLDGKERHEIRRKLRRLKEAGSFRFRMVEDDEKGIDLFITLFRKNTKGKQRFMNERMAIFFRDLTANMAREGILRLGFLDLDETPIASVLCFDYRSTRYLYNNGYDSRFSDLSPGTLSKVMCIHDAIEKGMNKFDFLRGSEQYKQRLGGSPVLLYDCRLEISLA